MKEIFDFGDHIIFNYKAQIKENSLTIGKDNIKLILGENTFIPNFDLFFISKPFVKEMKFSYVFSHYYSDKNLAGKTADFEIEIIEKISNKEDYKRLSDNFQNLVDDFEKNHKISKKTLNIEKTLKEKDDLIFNLEKLNLELNIDNQKNLEEFNKKAKSFATKAQEELEKHKTELKNHLENEFNEKSKYKLQDLFEQILNPLNNFKNAIDAGLKQNNLAIKNYVQGFDMLLNQTYSVLFSFGLKLIKPNIGDMFNPEFHHVFELKEHKPGNRILEIKSQGYMLYDRVIKPAIVIVSK